MYFIQCKATYLKAIHIKRREEFRQIHGKLKTAKIIHEGFMRIFISLRIGDVPPSSVTHYDSGLDRMLQLDWDTQRATGWDQILKGRIRKYWGVAQGMYYNNSPDTRGKLCFSSTLLAAKTVRSLLDFSLDCGITGVTQYMGRIRRRRKR